MTRPCPTHPLVRDATDRSCWRCEQDLEATDHEAGIARVRAALAAAPKPPSDQPTDQTHARALERARKEKR